MIDKKFISQSVSDVLRAKLNPVIAYCFHLDVHTAYIRVVSEAFEGMRLTKRIVLVHELLDAGESALAEVGLILETFTLDEFYDNTIQIAKAERDLRRRGK